MAPTARPRFKCACSLITAAAAVSSVASCVPARDLQEYSASSGGGGANGVSAPSVPAPNDAAVIGNGELPLPPGPGPDTNQTADAGVDHDPSSPPGGEPDAATEPPVADAATGAPSACATQELLGPNGHCYFLDANPLGWDLARSACQQRGAGWDLVSVRSAADSEFLGAALTFEAWLGASDGASEGTWVWVVDNQPFWLGTGANGSALGGAYANWNATEPNGATTTNCARALPRSFGSPNPNAPWADLACDAALGAICEAYPVL